MSTASPSEVITSHQSTVAATHSCPSPPAASMPTSTNCCLHVESVGGEWKDSYFADRPPRLAFTLRNVPPGLESLTLRAHTSFVGEVPVIRSKGMRIQRRYSDELAVRHMQVCYKKCMKSWAHCGRVVNHATGEQVLLRFQTKKVLAKWVELFSVAANGSGSGSGGSGQTVSGGQSELPGAGGAATGSASTSSSTGANLSACEGSQTSLAPLQLAATVWLKPNDIKAHLEVRDSMLTVTKLKDNPRGEPVVRWAFGSGAAGAAGTEASKGSRSLRDAVGVTPHFQRAVLNRANKFKAVVSFGFHTGYYGVQQYEVHPIVTDALQAANIPSPKATPEEVQSVAAPFCPAYLSPVFEVLSCNRHPPRCPSKTQPAPVPTSKSVVSDAAAAAAAAAVSAPTSRRHAAKRPTASGVASDPSGGASSSGKSTVAAPPSSKVHSNAKPVRGGAGSSSTGRRKSRRRARDDGCKATVRASSSCAIEDQAPADKIPRSPHRKSPGTDRSGDAVPVLNLAAAAALDAPFAASPTGASLLGATETGVLQRGATAGCGRSSSSKTARRRGSAPGGSSKSAAMSDQFSRLSCQGQGCLLRDDGSLRSRSELNGAAGQESSSPDGDEEWLGQPRQSGLQVLSQPWGGGAELGRQHAPEYHHLKQEESNAIDNNNNNNNNNINDDEAQHPMQWPMRLKKETEDDYAWEEGNHQPDNSYHSRTSGERGGFHGQFGPSSVWDPFLASQPLGARSSTTSRRRPSQHRHHHHHHHHRRRHHHDHHHHHHHHRGMPVGKRERLGHKSRHPGSTTSVGSVPRMVTTTTKMTMRFCPESEWMHDRDAKQCCNRDCDATFGFLVRRHHCRCCGMIFCASCCPKQSIPADVAAEAAAAAAAAAPASSSSQAAPSSSSPQSSSLPQRVRICHYCFVDSCAAGRPLSGAAAKVHALSSSGAEVPIGPILTDDLAFPSMHHGDHYEDDESSSFMEGLSCEDGALLSVPGRAILLEEPFYSAVDVGCSSLDQLHVSRTRVSSGASGVVSDFTEDDDLRQDFDGEAPCRIDDEQLLLCGKGSGHSPDSWDRRHHHDVPTSAGLEPCPDLFDEEDKFAAQGKRRPAPHLAHDGRSYATDYVL